MKDKTLQALRDLLNGERNQHVQDLVWHDDRLDQLVREAKRANPRTAESYASLSDYSTAVQAFERAVADAWERYGQLLWKYLAPQYAELHKVYSQVADLPATSVRMRFDTAFGSLYDRASGFVVYLAKADPKSADPVAVREKIAPAWKAVKTLRAASEALDRAGGLKPSVALANKTILANLLAQLDAIGSVEALARLTLETLTKRLDGNAENAELVYLALLPKAKREEHERAKRASIQAAPEELPAAPPEVVEPALVMPHAVEEFIAFGDRRVKPSRNGGSDLIWIECGKDDPEAMPPLKWATVTDKQLEKAPDGYAVFVRRTYVEPLKSGERKKIESALAQAEKEDRSAKRKK